jgi:hypothetical protein
MVSLHRITSSLERGAPTSRSVAFPPVVNIKVVVRPQKWPGIAFRLFRFDRNKLPDSLGIAPVRSRGRARAISPVYPAMASGEMASQFFAGGAAGVAVLLATVLTLAQASMHLSVFAFPSIRRSRAHFSPRRCTAYCVWLLLCPAAALARKSNRGHAMPCHATHNMVSSIVIRTAYRVCVCACACAGHAEAPRAARADRLGRRAAESVQALRGDHASRHRDRGVQVRSTEARSH